MKLLISILILAATLSTMAQSTRKPGVSRCNPAAEAVYKGTVVNRLDHQSPVSGGVGSHIIMKLETGNTIEVHLGRERVHQDDSNESSQR